MTLSKEKVETFRKQLMARRDTIIEGLRLATEELIQDEVSYSDTVDLASSEIDKSLTVQMKNRERTTLWQINVALKRLESGAYGECERCDESISEGRMEAFPFTTFCIDCKAELESEEQRYYSARTN